MKVYIARIDFGWMGKEEKIFSTYKKAKDYINNNTDYWCRSQHLYSTKAVSITEREVE